MSAPNLTRSRIAWSTIALLGFFLHAGSSGRVAWAKGRAERESLRVLVRLTSPVAEALWPRLEGQTVDIAVQLEAVVHDELEEDVRVQLSTADALMDERDADVAAWLLESPYTNEFTMVILERAQDQTVVAPINMPDRTDRSAALEAAALVFRGALQAFLAGERIGLNRPEVEASLAAPAPPSRAPRSPKALPPVVPVHSGSALGLFSVVSGDGFAPQAHFGVGANGFWHRDRLEIGVFGEITRQAVHHYRDVSVRLGRHAAGLTMSWRWLDGASYSASFGLGGGVLVLHRETGRIAETGSKTASKSTVVPWLGPSLSAQLRFDEVWALTLMFRADVPLQGVDFAVQRDGTLESIERPWVVQPVGIVGVLIYL